MPGNHFTAAEQSELMTFQDHGSGSLEKVLPLPLVAPHLPLSPLAPWVPSQSRPHSDGPTLSLTLLTSSYPPRTRFLTLSHQALEVLNSGVKDKVLADTLVLFEDLVVRSSSSI